jgi:hypothetical protein
MSKRYHELWPDQAAAKKAVRYAVRHGRITKPEWCHCCDTAHDRQHMEAHHWSYKPENWLDVIWLCRKCHKAVHKQLGKDWQEPCEKPVYMNKDMK